MRTKSAILLLSCLLNIFTLSSCRPADTDSLQTSLLSDTEISEKKDDPNSGFTEHNVIFPSGNDEITEYNKEILDIEKFTVSFLLPDGWYIQEKSSEDISEAYISVFSSQYIFDENDKYVGLVGYNIIPQGLSGEDFVPNAIYNQIALGNDYCFDIRGKYDVVSSSDTCETALTDVYYSNVITEDNGEKYNTGILTYDSLHGVYAAFDLDSSALTDSQCKEIAKSIKIY